MKLIDIKRAVRLARGIAQGQMCFWDNTLKKWTYTETSELIWDDTNKRLGLSTATPTDTLTVAGTAGYDAVTDMGETDTDFVHKKYVDDGVWLFPPIIEWYDPVDEGGLPVDPEIGDRYGADSTGFGWTIDYIYEWDGSEWIESEPEDGWLIWDLFGLILWVFFSGGWMEINNVQDGTAQGQIAFWDDTIGRWTNTETSELFWDDINKRLGIGTATPSEQLDLTGNINIPTTSATIGIIKQNGVRLIHTFAHPTGDTAIPTGHNTFLGEGCGNYSVGSTATATYQGSDNVGLGYQALVSLTSGYQNFGLGTQSLNNVTTGRVNIAIGNQTGFRNTTGNHNIGIGSAANNNNSTGSFNVAIGSQALTGVNGDSSDNNIGIGFRAGNVITTASNNIFMGYQAGNNLTTGSNNILIGYDIDAQAVDSDETLSIGNIIFGTGVDGTGTTVSTGNIGIGEPTPVSRFHITNTTTTTVAQIIQAAASQSADLLQYQKSDDTVYSGVDSDGERYQIDDVKNYFGTGNDGAIYYDGTDFIIDSSAGDLILSPDENVGINVAAPTARLHLPAGTATANTAPLKFTDGTLLTTPEPGTIEYSDDRYYITNVGTQKAIDRTSDVKIDTTTVTDTTTETTVYTGLIPANALKARNILKLNMFGVIDEAAASDEVTIRVKLGTTTMATILSPASGVSAKCWYIHGVAILRTVGASGSIAWHMDMNAAGNTVDACGIDTVDTTTAENVTVTAEWNNAKAGNIFTCIGGFLEYKN